MALIVENGSVVANANSYTTVEATQAYATARGLSLPASSADVEKLLIVAMDYLEGLRAEYQGSKTAKNNPLQWPRSGVVVDGFAIEQDEIPSCLVQAQQRLACYAHANDGALTEVSDGRVVIGERVEGAVDVKYADHGDHAPQPQFPEADALLAPLLESSAFGGEGFSVRV